MGILENIKNPSDIKELNNEQLSLIAKEIRSQILEVTKNNGGHLSSNLGVVESTIAIHKVFDLSKDRLVFDVGHQCYAHKILSGRANEFNTVRLKGGISGFPDIQESVYDAFSTGHAGTSISASLGICEARDKQGKDFCVINVVGDGSLVNGLNLEAITSSNQKPKNLIVVLNDNGMSISKNKNGFYKMISRGTTRKGYIRSKTAIKRMVGKSFLARWLGRFRNFIKRLFNGDNYFENYGFKYVGVIDGNDLKQMVKILERAKFVAKEKAVFLHVKTTKGKGYDIAEESAELYHGVGKDYKISSGTMSCALGEKINALIDENPLVVALTAGMKQGTGLDKVELKHPKNFYDVGIAEEFACTFAGGMASNGLKPIVAIYSTFLQRCYDQIVHDICMQNLPVIFCLDRAGFVGEDGKTHQGLFDLSYLSHIPNLTILSPINETDLSLALDYAIKLNSPVAIRYSKNGCDKEFNPLPYQDNLWQKVKDGKDITVLAVGGRMLSLALDFASVSEKSVKVIAVRGVKPIDKELLKEISSKTIITLEENLLAGGFGSLLKDSLDGDFKVISLGVDDKFVGHGDVGFQMESCGLTVDNMINLTK